MTATTSRITRAGQWLTRCRDRAVFHVEHWLADHGHIEPRRASGSTWDVQRFTDAYYDYMNTGLGADADRAIFLERFISQQQVRRARRLVEGPRFWELRMAARLIFIPAAIGLALGAVILLIVRIAGGSL